MQGEILFVDVRQVTSQPLTQSQDVTGSVSGTLTANLAMCVGTTNVRLSLTHVIHPLVALTPTVRLTILETPYAGVSLAISQCLTQSLDVRGSVLLIQIVLQVLSVLIIDVLKSQILVIPPHVDLTQSVVLQGQVTPSVDVYQTTFHSQTQSQDVGGSVREIQTVGVGIFVRTTDVCPGLTHVYPHLVDQTPNVMSTD